MKIRAEIEQTGKAACGFAVPEEVVLALGKGKRPPVTVTIKGYTYRSTVAPMGRSLPGRRQRGQSRGCGRGRWRDT